MLKIINLSLLTKDIPERFDIVQYSIEPEIGFNISDVKIDSTFSARIYAQKPSGFKVYSECTISNNIIRFTPTTQMFAEVGVTQMQLQITVSDKLLYSFIIHANVTPNMIDDSAVESQDEFTALQEAISNLGQYDARLQTLEDHTVKDNEDGSINGTLYLTGNLVSEGDGHFKGAELYIQNTGNTGLPYETLYFRNSSGNMTYIRAYDGNENGSALCIQPGGPLILGGGEYASNRYNVGDIDPTANERTYIGSDGTMFFEVNANNIGERKTISINNGGVINAQYFRFRLYSKDRLDDSGENAFFPIISVGDNLWFGKVQTKDSYAHTGTTNISTGIRPANEWQASGVGYKTIWVSVATEATVANNNCAYVTNATNYEVFHAGYLDVSKATDGTLPVARGGTGSNAFGSEIYNLHGEVIPDKVLDSSTNWQNLGSITFANAGTYLIVLYCRYSANSAGRRALSLSTSNSSSTMPNIFHQFTNAVNGVYTDVRLVTFLKAQANTPYYINGAQTSGNSLTVSTRVACMRLK